MSPLAAAFVVFGLLCVIMTIVWFAGKRIGKWALVDPVWGASIGFNVIAFSLLVPSGSGIRKFAIGVVAAVYSLRLGSYLAIRVIRHQEDDPRYAKLHQDWGSDGNWKMYRFFIYQAIGSLLLCLSPFVAILTPKASWTLTDTLATCIAAIAILGEAISDAQLKAFKNRSETKGQVCQSGLWRYSRHPNYFFQWMFWLSFPVYAIGSDWWLLSLLGAALMLHFLLRVTGIPLTEKQLLKSKGNAYREYQKQVSAFVPWIPRNFRKNNNSTIITS